MDILKKIFPFSFRSKTIQELLINILIYIAINVVGGLVLGLLGILPLIGFVFSAVGGLLGVYTLAGVILASLHFWGMLKD